MFDSRPLPYDTTDTDNRIHTVVAILSDGKVVTVRHTGLGFTVPQVFHPTGAPHGPDRHGYAQLRAPELVGYHEYGQLHASIRELIDLTIREGRKIAGIKGLRALLDLGLTDAKALWEHLEVVGA